MQQRPAEFFKTVLLLALFAAGSVAAQPSSNDNILTIDELLRIENVQVRDAAKKSAIAAGLMAPNTPSGPSASAGPKRPAAAVSPIVTIHAIKGVGTQYRVDLSYNSETHRDVEINSRVKGRFVLTKVQDACVTVSSLDKAFESAVACWTGFDPEPSEAQALAGLEANRGGSPLPVPPLFGRPMPMPMPTVANPNQSPAAKVR